MIVELTLDQALQKGIEAHKAGKVQEADRLYTAILKANPKHPDANHNMGVLAVGVGKVEAALPFFKSALEVNQTIAQFWLSYIDALIKLNRMDDAKAVFDQSKSNGLQGEGFDQLEQRLDVSKNPDATMIGHSEMKDPPQNQIQALIDLYSKGQLRDVLSGSSQLLSAFPNSVSLLNVQGVANHELGKFEEAIEAYTKALSLKPDYADAHNNMGNALKDQGKLEEAIQSYTKALSLKPDYAQAHSNMGNALKEKGKLDEAIEAYTKALSLKPDYAQAHSNMGNALQEQGKLEEAAEAFNKALTINPDFADAYYNMGNALRGRGKLDEAIEAYKKAISIKRDYAEAYNNMGVALKDQGKLEGSIEAYTKGLSFNPDYAEAYNNMGNALKEQGKLEEAIETYTKALSIKPDYAQAWSNLYFSLQAIKFQKKPDQDLNALYLRDINSNYSKIELSILDYRLHRGQESEGIYLEKAISSLSNAKNITIQNPTFDKSTQKKIQISPDRMVALVHFGRSGTGLMHSLIDGHPEVSTLPSIYFSEYFDLSTWTKITSDGWDGMVDRFIEIYEVLFDPTSSVPIVGKSKKLIHNIGVKEGMANVGEQKDEVLSLDKGLFREELKRLIASYDGLDAFLFFKLLHDAYNAAIYDFNSKNLIFYHIHNPDTYAQLNFFRLAPHAKWVMMVREPIQSLESWADRDKEKNWHSKISNNILSMLFEIDNVIYSNKSSVGVRLEDLKTKPRRTIPALCKWMGIKESEQLYEMTAQGKKWWGDPTSPDYEKDGNQPFGKTSIKRKVGSIFSENDQFILRTLFYPFSVRFGYAEENKEQFKGDLDTIRPMLDDVFDFERTLIEQTGDDTKTFKKSVSYLYLRSGLIERWNTLDKFYTYPNMIPALKIN